MLPVHSDKIENTFYKMYDTAIHEVRFIEHKKSNVKYKLDVELRVNKP